MIFDFSNFFFRFKRKFRLFVFPLIALTIAVYFIYHAVEGSRGLRRYFELKRQIRLERKVQELTKQRKTELESKIDRLSVEHMDTDFLEEQVKRSLGAGQENEYILFENENPRQTK